ncbi:metallophosphoesterase family protein [Robertmurraya kyonggiensis]|uniref:DNA repair exonuclease n=1 Tax=Robertmurraya kyonggiensis TaxID=1037680 RepID=A0A4V5P2Z9_9BACI|nr:DNA repair exonuclease [Robertmurraya kyonggiensis]TKC18150.1 DNA repair exonuclease [Robertmurraya kyonggiensis]
MKKVKFIHGADIHIDSPMVGLKSLPPRIFKRLQESTFHAFRSLIDASITNHVDFVILAGDLFDNEKRSVRAQVFLRKEMERLAEKEIDVFLIHGNHDHLSGNWSQIELPSNVHVFGEQIEVKSFTTKNNVIVHLYGFSYPERHVYERKIDAYVRKAGADFQIGILHGNMEGSTEHGNYAPFQLNDLLEKEFHYWALGHIHKRAILKEEPAIIYPGNTQGRNRKETGVKGCYLVELDDSGSSFEFVETSDVVWSEVLIDASDVSSFDQLYQLSKDTIENIRVEGKGNIATFQISNLAVHLKNLDELIETLQEDEKDEVSFVWVSSMKFEEKLIWDRQALKKESDFYGELFDVLEQSEGWDELLTTLYKNPVARKFLTPLLTAEVEEISKEAETVLIEKLLRNG